MLLNIIKFVFIIDYLLDKMITLPNQNLLVIMSPNHQTHFLNDHLKFYTINGMLHYNNNFNSIQSVMKLK